MPEEKQVTLDKNCRINRKGWAPGPWDSEPDRKEWRHQGLPCLIIHNDSGALCGYVGVPLNHPATDTEDFNVHGGITYGARCDDERICHVPRQGEEKEVFWLGFDCAHCEDLCPNSISNWRTDAVYRDIEYVTGEVDKLADQIVALT